MKKLLTATCMALLSLPVMAQENTTEKKQEGAQNTQFMLTGFGFAGFTKAGDGNATFGPTGFNPIFLWKKSDKLFFESELAFEMEGGETKLNLEYAVIHYKMCSYLDLAVGKFLSPFGIFNERIHPSWVNKFADNPLGFNHDVGTMVGPMSELGVELAGGAQIGKGKINYSFYISNGPNLMTDTMMAGMLMYSNTADNNGNKAVGGRIGYLPFSNSCFEIGLSGQFAKVGDAGTEYEKTAARLFAVDMAFNHKIPALKSHIDLKCQMNQVSVDKVTTYPAMAGMSSVFENVSTSTFAQLAIRPSYVDNNFVKNLELAGRYSHMVLPTEAMWGGEYTQLTVGLNYWLSWHSVIKFDYQINQIKDGDSKPSYMVQFGLGF